MIPLVNDVTKCVVQEGHVKAEAVALAHRIAIMQKGRSEQVGTAEALRSEPVTEAVARFMTGAPNSSYTD